MRRQSIAARAGRATAGALRAAGLAVAAAGALAACRAAGGPSEGDGASAPGTAVEARIAALEQKVAAAPRLYPAWAELGEAWLERARVSRDPLDVDRSRAAFARSLELQENAVALRGMVALANYRHRFDEALAWAPRARAAWPEDTTVLAMQVEALLELGRLDEARGLVAAAPPREDDFHTRCACARVLLAEGRVDQAAAAYLGAAEWARSRSAPLARWATVRAAAAWIDTGAPERALPLLEGCLAEAPDDVDALVHRAEAEAGLGHDAAALALYERALAVAPDPFLHAAAAPLARRVGDGRRAARHEALAERALRTIEAAGELYAQHARESLGASAAE